MTPQQFLEAIYPKYVYRDHRGTATAQWRQAALDLAAQQVELVEEVRALREHLSNLVRLVEATAPRFGRAIDRADALLAKLEKKS
jgi:pyruvate-formate lyase